MTTTYQPRNAKTVADNLWPAWYRQEKRKLRRDDRTEWQQDFDSGVFAASEFIRRFTGDEDLALAVHLVCFWSRNERHAVEQNPERR